MTSMNSKDMPSGAAAKTSPAAPPPPPAVFPSPAGSGTGAGANVYANAGGGSTLVPWGPWQWAAFALLACFCAFSRLYDLGHKAPMHDESLFLYYSFEQLFRTWSYNYMPILHGPLMLQLQTLVWYVFGHSDYTMRLGCALLGIGGFFLVRGLRPWFGEAGTWAALVLYTVSTMLAYYQRFYRNDALFMFLCLLITLCACRWYRTGSWRWLMGLVLAVTALFCNKENCVIFYFSGISFTLFWIIQDMVQWALKGKDARAIFANPWVKAPAQSILRDAVQTKELDAHYQASVSAKAWTDAPPRVPNVFWLNAALWGAVMLCIIQIFDQMPYDPAYVKDVGREFPMKNVRTIHLLLGFPAAAPKGVDPNAVSPPFERSSVWRLFYGVGFLTTLAGLFLAKIAIREELGYREVLARLWSGLARNRWWFAAAAALALVLYLGVFTTWLEHPRGPFQIYRDTFSYWVTQHALHRLRGPFHYYMVILMIYEMPAILLVLGGWFYALGRVRWGRYAALPALALITLAAIVYFNGDSWNSFFTSPLIRGGETLAPTGEKWLDTHLKITSGVHIYLIVVLSFMAVVLGWTALWRGEVFHAWLIWWTVTSIGGYSYAGEKAPWIGAHVALPLILLAASYVGKLWNTPRVRRHAVIFGILMGLFALWNAKAMINACFRNSDDIRERVLYGHFSQDIHAHAKAVQDYVSRASIRSDWQRNHNDFKLHKKVSVLVRSDSSIWPLYWYLRDIDYRWNPPESDLKEADKTYQFLFLNPEVLNANPQVREKYTIYEGRGTCFWVPQLPDWKRLVDIWINVIPQQYLDLEPAKQTRAKNARDEWKKLIRYQLKRETFEYPNAPYPSVSSSNYFFCVRKDVDL